jgi:hypothetical protein
MSTAATTHTAVRLEFTRRPSALRYMAGAFLPSPGLDPQAGFPDISARWSGYRASGRELADFLFATGGAPISPPRHLPLLFPHTIGFRLQMALLTHPAFPLPIWRVLQVRNRLLQHRPIEAGEALDFETRVEAHRALEKGLEVDLRTTALVAERTVWECLNTFYVRGRFGIPQEEPPAARAPEPPREVVARWHMASDARLRFGFLTGDYNGLHLWGAYAKRLGFEGAFYHTQRVLGHCLAHLDEMKQDQPQRLDAWLKGPVYYGSDVRLCAARHSRDTTFALFSRQEERPAIVARIRNVPAAAASLRVATAGEA